MHLLGPLAVFAVVMGGIYTGWATVTESAALGVIVCLPIAAAYGKLNVAMLHECFRSTMRLTAMTALILVAALYLNFVLSMLGVPQALASLIKSADVSPIMLLWMLAVMYLVLGIALETMPMLVGTLPVVFPIIQAAGIDPVFFGVFMVLMCEISLISPPIGMTLYVIQGVRGEGSINDVFQGTLPFFAAMIVMTAILIHTPSIATYLPNLMFGKMTVPHPERSHEAPTRPRGCRARAAPLPVHAENTEAARRRQPGRRRPDPAEQGAALLRELREEHRPARSTADYKPMDVLGVKDADGLRVIKSGLFDIVTLRLAQVSRDEPFLLGPDIVGLSTDYDIARKVVDA